MSFQKTYIGLLALENLEIITAGQGTTSQHLKY